MRPRLRTILAFLIIAGTLSFLFARWPAFSLGASCALILFTLPFITIRSALRRKWPTFSVGTLLLVTGLIVSAIALARQGQVWKEVHRFPGYEVNIAMSPDGKLVAASQGLEIEVRETRTGNVVSTITCSSSELASTGRWVYGIEFTPDSKSLVIGHWRKQGPCVVDIESGRITRQWNCDGTVRISTFGNRLIASNRNSSMYEVFDVDEDDSLLSIPSSKRMAFSWSKAISAGGKYVIVGKTQAVAALWDVDNARIVGELPIVSRPTAFFFASFSPDEKLVALQTATGIATWDVATATKQSEWSATNCDTVNSIAWSHDSKRLIVSYTEMIGPTNAAPAITQNASNHGVLLDRQLKELASIVGGSGCFSPSGDRVAAIHGHIQILDSQTGRYLTGISQIPSSGILGNKSLRFSPDGNWLFHNSQPVVHRRLRSEHWFSIHGVPAFWGVVAFIAALIVIAIPNPGSSRSPANSSGEPDSNSVASSALGSGSET